VQALLKEVETRIAQHKQLKAASHGIVENIRGLLVAVPRLC
jgi:hypothetical protein